MGPSHHLEAKTNVRPRLRLAALRRAWPLALALIVVAVLGAGFTCTRYGRAATISALFLPDAMVSLPVRPITWLTEDPIVEREYIDYGSGRIMADIYRPPDSERHAAIVFSMGAPPLDLDDHRLVRLAEDAARSGVAMVVPFSRRLDAELIEAEEVEALVGIFEYLEEQPYVDQERIGYIGVSVGASLAILAAADPRIAGRVDYVVSFGGYFNAVDAFAAIASGRIAYDGETETWEPDKHSVEVMALQFIVELPDRSDRQTLCKAFVDPGDRLALCNIADREPVTPGEVARLTPEGRAAYRFLTEGDPELLAQLPATMREKLEHLSPEGVIDGLAGQVFIIHDRGDEYIPYVESRRMRDALAGHEDTHYTEVSLFEHVEPRLDQRSDVIVVDGTRLYYRLYQLLLELL